MHCVIIGNSAAAVGCIEGIRQVDEKAAITVISDEYPYAYSRPLISYLLCGKTDETSMKYRDESFYAANGAEVLAHKHAMSIDPVAKTVTLCDKSVLSYDRLLVATGSRPFVPPMEGLDTVKERFAFMTLTDAHALDAALSRDKRVLIVGAGLIGLKCAEGIAEKCGSVTIIDAAPRILSSILDEEGSQMVQRRLESNGMRFILNDTVASFEDGCAHLKSGAKVDFDILVTAVGVRPNVSLVEDAGGNVERGIVIDSHCMTSLEDIYAAGDCAEGVDISSGERRPTAVLPCAYAQGECAGKNMAGGSADYNEAMPQNAIGFFGLHMITAGVYKGESRIMSDAGSYRRFFLQDDRLMGYIMIGSVEKAGIYTALIRERTPLSSIDFDLICEHPGLMAFSAQKRREILGGEKQ